MRLAITILSFFLAIKIQARNIIAGTGQPVNSLKKAIQIANNKDTITLLPGIYKEGALQLTKSITIIGINYPVLDGEKKFEILLISAANVIIRGLVFKNSGYSAMNDYASIKVVDASNITIEGNRIYNAYFAIHVSNTSNINIKGNEIKGSPLSEQLTGNGIHLWKSNNALIDNNRVTGHRDGIYFEFVTFSTIQNNLSQQNIRYGLHFMFSNDDKYINNVFRNNGAGVAVMYSKKVIMDRNHFEQNWGPTAYGILLKDISDSHITHNTFLKNTVGIHMEGSSRMTIEKNIFKENGWAVKVQASCENNDFHHNNFSGNSFDVGTNGSISLNNFTNNYWDKYEGYDINKDGIGDVPYHPVSMYSMIIEQNPNALMLLRSFTVQLLDKAEKAIPSLTPENLTDNKPMMKSLKL
ncbi:MAG TPA: nitrous oxide reductase family maturation protein NosD [Chitinophagaceae bacterium]|nr:nitrous oxide reductase family maturation protein NosD [Chitinophagaceae bacterium]